MSGRRTSPENPRKSLPVKPSNLGGLREVRDRVIFTLSSKRHKYVIKSTSRDNEAVRLEYVRRIIDEVWETHESKWILQKVQERPIVEDCVVAFKALIVMHRVLQQGPGDVVRDWGVPNPILDRLVSHWGVQVRNARPSQQRHCFQAVADYAGLVQSKMEFMAERSLGAFSGNWAVEDASAERTDILQLLSGLLNFSEQLMQLALHLVAPSKDLKRLDRSLYMRLYISGILALLDESWSLLCTISQLLKTLLCQVHAQKKKDSAVQSMTGIAETRPLWLQLAEALLATRPRFFWFHSSICDFVAHCHQLRCAGFPYIAPCIPKVPQGLLNLFADLNEMVRSSQTAIVAADITRAPRRESKDGSMSSVSTTAGSGPFDRGTPRCSDGSFTPPPPPSEPSQGNVASAASWEPSTRVLDAFRTVDSLKRPMALADHPPEAAPAPEKPEQVRLDPSLSGGLGSPRRRESFPVAGSGRPAYRNESRSISPVPSNNVQMASRRKATSMRPSSPERPQTCRTSNSGQGGRRSLGSMSPTPAHMSVSCPSTPAASLRDGNQNGFMLDRDRGRGGSLEGGHRMGRGGNRDRDRDSDQDISCEPDGSGDAMPRWGYLLLEESDEEPVSAKAPPPCEDGERSGAASVPHPSSPILIEPQPLHNSPGSSARRTRSADPGRPADDGPGWNLENGGNLPTKQGIVTDTWAEAAIWERSRTSWGFANGSEAVTSQDRSLMDREAPQRPSAAPAAWAEAICRSNVKRDGGPLAFLNAPPMQQQPVQQPCKAAQPELEPKRPFAADAAPNSAGDPVVFAPAPRLGEAPNASRPSEAPRSWTPQVLRPRAQGQGPQTVHVSPPRQLQRTPRESVRERELPVNPFDMNTLQIQRAALGLDPNGDDWSPWQQRNAQRSSPSAQTRGSKQTEWELRKGSQSYQPPPAQHPIVEIPPAMPHFNAPNPQAPNAAGVQQVLGPSPQQHSKDASRATAPAARENAGPFDWEVDQSELHIEERIGTGATAEVFRANWHGTDVAVKRLQHRGPMPSEFLRELSVLLRLRHPNLVLFMGASTSGCPTIISEYCSGGNAFVLLHQRREVQITWPSRVKIALDVSKGMNFLHRRQVVHRDLKSLNLLLTAPVNSWEDVPQVKISDFGLSRAREAHTSWDKIFMTGNAGTYHWMAPEVLDGRSYDEKVDIYSYGICLFEVISRCIPFEETGLEPVSVAVAVSKGRRPDLGCIPPECPVDLRLVMECCWAHSPMNRPSFDSILETLKLIKFL